MGDEARVRALLAEGEAAAPGEPSWALHRGLAIVLRQHLLAQDDGQCSSASAANWAAVQILGEALQREAGERDGAAASELAGIWALSAPTTADIERGAELIDQVFDCP